MNVLIRLSLIVETPGNLPRRIDKLVPIVLGRTLLGDSIPDTALFPGTQGEGEVEVHLDLTTIDALESRCTQLSLGITQLGSNGIVKTSETDVPLLPKSEAYRQLELIQEAYKSRTTGYGHQSGR